MRKVKINAPPKKGKIWCNGCQKYHKFGAGHETQKPKPKSAYINFIAPLPEFESKRLFAGQKSKEK